MEHSHEEDGQPQGVPSRPQQVDGSQPSIDFSRELELEERSRNALFQSVVILRERGRDGQDLLRELLLVNQQLPRPVEIEELPIIADFPLDMDADAYIQMMDTLRDAATRLHLHEEPTATDEAVEPTPAALDQAIANTDVKGLYANVGVLVSLRQNDAVGYIFKKEAIKAAFGKTVNMNDLERLVGEQQRKAAKEERGEKLDVAEVAKYWTMAHRQDWAYDAKLKLWRHWNGQCWEALEHRSQELELEAIAALHDAGIDINSGSGMDCFQRVAVAELTIVFFPGVGKINFENGTLDLESMTLYPFQREDHLTYCLEYCYAPAHHPTINKFLRETIPDVHARQAFMAHLGLALLQDTLMHQVLVLLGPTRSGKSTLLALANAVCGTSSADNFAEDFSFAGPSLFSRELEGKRSRYQWGNRRIVCADEIPAEALKDEELFKTMSAHGGVEKRGMHKDETTGNRWRPKMILAANDRPRYRDVSGAVKERCTFVTCPNHRRREQRDPQLFGTLRAEIGPFAASCILLAQRLLERGYYPLSYAQKHTQDVIAREGNHVKAFLAECCIVGDATNWSVSDSIYNEYLSFCANSGITNAKLAKHVLSASICNMAMGVSAKRGRHESRVVCGLQGIRLREAEDIWATDEDELNRYADDRLLVDQTEMLTVIHGQLTVVPKTSNAANEPVEPVEELSLPVLMAQNQNTLSEEIPLVTTPLDQVDQGQGVPLEEQKLVEMPPTLSTIRLEVPVEQIEDVDGSNDISTTCQHAATYICNVRDCGQPAIIHDPANIEEEERTYGLWCASHQACYENMLCGELLDPRYPRVALSVCSSMCEGHEAWLHFHQHPQASVATVNAAVYKLVEGQQSQSKEESA